MIIINYFKKKIKFILLAGFLTDGVGPVFIEK